jgi:multicomponent Na+:H+ antiporter subunit D
MDYSPYDTSHVLAQLQLLFFSALAFTWLKLSGIYPPELRSVNIDAEWIYRRLIPRALHGIRNTFTPVFANIRARLRVWSQKGFTELARSCGDYGLLSATRSIGGMVMWVALLLATSLLLYYL